eukprot:3600110-Rhodomonas_salina.1
MEQHGLGACASSRSADSDELCLQITCAITGLSSTSGRTSRPWRCAATLSSARALTPKPRELHPEPRGA